MKMEYHCADFAPWCWSLQRISHEFIFDFSYL